MPNAGHKASESNVARPGLCFLGSNRSCGLAIPIVHFRAHSSEAVLDGVETASAKVATLNRNTLSHVVLLSFIKSQVLRFQGYGQWRKAAR